LKVSFAEKRLEKQFDNFGALFLCWLIGAKQSIAPLYILTMPVEKRCRCFKICEAYTWIKQSLFNHKLFYSTIARTVTANSLAAS
jgi:hypothetical protein